MTTGRRYSVIAWNKQSGRYFRTEYGDKEGALFRAYSLRRAGYNVALFTPDVWPPKHVKQEIE